MMNKEEGRIISENPLRVLGVYSDTPKKEIVANLGKLRAFAKTGKYLSFDSDFTSLLGPIDRTIEKIEKANNDISLPKDKLHAGMFWFMQHTDNDKAALNCLKTGNTDETFAIIKRKGNFSGVINMAVLALVLKRWDIALYSYAYLLESPLRRGALIKAFTDAEDYFSEEDLVDFISGKLINEFPSAHWIEQLQHENVELGDKTYPFKSRFENSKLLNKISSECTKTIKKAIDEVLDKASSIQGNDAKGNLLMAEFVEEKCKPLLKDLRLALGKDHNTYIEYADKVANQIIDNCIDYYTHDADNTRRAKNVIKYTRYAYRIAEGKTTKERAQKNLVILNKTLENLIPDSIEEDFNAIDKMVMNYHDINAKVDYTDHLAAIVDEGYQRILSIKSKIGKDNKHYISISSNFVYFAYQEVVKKINAVSEDSSYLGRNKYVSSLLWARSIFDTLAKFDKDEECQKVFNENFNTLMELVKSYADKPKTTSYTPNQAKTVYHNKPQSSSGSSNKELYFGLALIAFLTLMLFLGIRNNKSNHSSEKIPSESVYNNQTASDDYSANGTDMTESPSSYADDEQVEEPVDIVYFNTGDRPYIDYYGKGKYDKKTRNALKIKNGSNTDAVVFLETISGNKIRHVYIRRNESFTMVQIPGGKYIIIIMQGNDWNQNKNNGEEFPAGGFMNDISMSKSESSDPFVYPAPSTGQFGTYEVTLYKVENGNMHTETINENEMF